MHQVSSCTATISGQALADSEVRVYWNGYTGGSYNDPSSYNWEEYLAMTGSDTDGDGLGAFSVTVPIIGGAGAENYVDVNDVNWNWTGVSITTTDASCAYVPPVMTVDAVSAGGALLTPNMYGEFDAATNGTVTISGTSSTAGRTIVANVFACSGAEFYDTLASTTANGSGTFDWSITVNVYDGWNNVDVNDGVSYVNVPFITANGVFPTPAMDATVDGLTPTYEGCGFRSYDAGAATTATISGTTAAPDGTGSYFNGSGTAQTFDITNGAFSFTVDLYDGGNYIGINDTNWNYFNVDIFTTNGNVPPRLLEIKSPLHDDVIDTTTGPVTVTVTGTIDSSSGFAPERVNAYVYDEGAMESMEYSSDTYEQTAYGRMPLAFDSAAGAFSFDVAVSSDQPVNINVDACSDTTGECHGHSIVVNNQYFYGEYSYKPGAGSTNKDRSVGAKARTARAIMHMRQQH